MVSRLMAARLAFRAASVHGWAPTSPTWRTRAGLAWLISSTIRSNLGTWSGVYGASPITPNTNLSPEGTVEAGPPVDRLPPAPAALPLPPPEQPARASPVATANAARRRAGTRETVGG